MVRAACVQHWAFSRELPFEISVGRAGGSPLQIKMFYIVSCAIGELRVVPRRQAFVPVWDEGIFFIRLEGEYRYEGTT